MSPETLVTGSLAPANDWLPAVPVPVGTQGWQVLSKLHLNPQCSTGAALVGTPPPGSPPPTPTPATPSPAQTLLGPQAAPEGQGPQSNCTASPAALGAGACSSSPEALGARCGVCSRRKQWGAMAGSGADEDLQGFNSAKTRAGRWVPSAGGASGCSSCPNLHAVSGTSQASALPREAQSLPEASPLLGR